ncbi:hypothetical protein Hamer_G002472, partial [Homarus americanus]
ASKVKLFNVVRSLLFGDSVDVGLREDHGEASQVNVAESRSVIDELLLLEPQIKLKEVGIPRAARLMPMRSWTRSPLNGVSKFSTYTCSFCGKPGHKAEFCWTRLQLNTGKPAMIVTEEANTSPVGVMAGLSKADSMPIALVSTKGEPRESAVSVLTSRDFDLFQEGFAKDPDVGTFRPFLSQGTVEVDGAETPVTILRDSGCLQTLIKEGVVAARKTDKYVVLGSLWGQGVASLVLVRVKSSCFSGITNVACVHELPVAGVDLILGNDLAGGQMGNVTPPPVLRERPESAAELQQLEDDMPDVFPLCAVTRSMSMTNDHYVTPDVDDSLSLEGLFANPIASQDISSAVNAVTGRVAFIAAQEQDDSLQLLFDQINCSGAEEVQQLCAIADTGAQVCLAGLQHVRALGTRPTPPGRSPHRREPHCRRGREHRREQGVSSHRWTCHNQDAPVFCGRCPVSVASKVEGSHTAATSSISLSKLF